MHGHKHEMKIDTAAQVLEAPFAKFGLIDAIMEPLSKV